MEKHADILRPKFTLVEKTSSPWAFPKSADALGRAARRILRVPSTHLRVVRRIVQLAKEAGVTMTDAGATWPYKHDPYDSNIRIAPTLPALRASREAI